MESLNYKTVVKAPNIEMTFVCTSLPQHEAARLMRRTLYRIFRSTEHQIVRAMTPAYPSAGGKYHFVKRTYFSGGQGLTVSADVTAPDPMEADAILSSLIGKVFRHQLPVKDIEQSRNDLVYSWGQGVDGKMRFALWTTFTIQVGLDMHPATTYTLSGSEPGE